MRQRSVKLRRPFERSFMKRQPIPEVVCAIAALLFASCSETETALDNHGGSHVVHWGYEVNDGPEAWSSMASEWILCAEGLEQSPIDLADAIEIDLPAVDIDTPSEQEVEVLNQEGVIGALDNGHTIQVNTKDGGSMTVGDKTYALLQFHFHSPSEHTVDGKHLPMEMHFVHQAEDGALAVAGVLIEEGAENPAVGTLWPQLLLGPGAKTTIQIPAGFDENIFPDAGTGFYHYEGSLTTPPCSERVQWYVRISPTPFSREQITAFKAHYDHNNRPVQALNERSLYVDENPTVRVY